MPAVASAKVGRKRKQSAARPRARSHRSEAEKAAAESLSVRDEKGRLLPGSNLNPLGRTALPDWLRASGHDALRYIADVAIGKEYAETQYRLKAAEYIVERVYGKAPERVEVDQLVRIVREFVDVTPTTGARVLPPSHSPQPMVVDVLPETVPSVAVSIDPVGCSPVQVVSLPLVGEQMSTTTDGMAVGRGRVGGYTNDGASKGEISCKVDLGAGHKNRLSIQEVPTAEADSDFSGDAKNRLSVAKFAATKEPTVTEMALDELDKLLK